LGKESYGKLLEKIIIKLYLIPFYKSKITPTIIEQFRVKKLLEFKISNLTESQAQHKNGPGLGRVGRNVRRPSHHPSAPNKDH